MPLPFTVISFARLMFDLSFLLILLPSIILIDFSLALSSIVLIFFKIGRCGTFIVLSSAFVLSKVLVLFGVLVLIVFSSDFISLRLILSVLVFVIFLFGFSSIGFLSMVLIVDFVNLGFSSDGRDALSICFAAEGFTSFSSIGCSSGDIPFEASLIVACFLRRAKKWKVIM